MHPYIGHYDEEKYKKAMKKYRSGKLKSRPNGRKWHKIRYNRDKDQAQSDLEILMANYNFDLRDLWNEEKEKRIDYDLRRDVFSIYL